MTAIIQSVQLRFVPSMEALAKEIESLNQVIKKTEKRRTTSKAEKQRMIKIIELQDALVNHTVDPLVDRCKTAPAKNGVKPDLLSFVLASGTLQGTYKHTSLAGTSAAYRVSRLLYVAMSPLLSLDGQKQDAQWFVDRVVARLNLLIPPDSPLVIRGKVGIQKGIKKYAGAPTIDFIAVNRH